MTTRLSILLLVAMNSPLAASSWIKLSSPHFELYTDSPEAVGRSTLQQFEQIRSFYAQIPEFRQGNLLPARIVEFSSAQDFSPYRSVGLEAGHYESNFDRDWIALGPMDGSNRFQVEAHEYNHLVVRRAMFHFPIWLLEGFADLFSTLTPSSGKTAVGAAVEHDLQVLRTQPWLDIGALTSLDRPGFESMMNAASGDRAHLFYAESWALAHMLYLGPGYAEDFPKFMAALNRGSTTAETFQAVYGRSPAAVFADLKAYWHDSRQPTKLFAEGMDLSPVRIVVRPVGEFESSVVRADLLAVMNSRKKEAIEAFDQIELSPATMEQIRLAPPEQSISIASMYIHLAQDVWNPAKPNERLLITLENISKLPVIDSARPDLADAMAELHYFVALFEIVARQPLPKITEPLQRALRLRPVFPAATLRLAEVYRSAHDYSAAIECLAEGIKVSPDDRRIRVLLGNSYLDGKDYQASLAVFRQVPPDSNEASYVQTAFHTVAADYLKANRFDDAIRICEQEREWAGTLDVADIDRRIVGIWRTAAHFSLDRGDVARAKAQMETAAALTKDPFDVERNRELQTLIEARSKGPYASRRGEVLARVEGLAAGLECPASGPLLRLVVNGNEMRFDLPSPAAVEMIGTSGASIDLHCGELKAFRVAIEYAAPGATSKASAGIVRKMGF
jgi:tetratricopeptide (TPR) repeat protein